MAEERLTFKEMCARFDVTPRTLRYYEYIELLRPEKEGRSRFYGPRELARMTLILRGRRFGFSLEEIRQWLEIYEEEGHRGADARVGAACRPATRRPRRGTRATRRHDRRTAGPAGRRGARDRLSRGPRAGRKPPDLTLRKLPGTRRHLHVSFVWQEMTRRYAYVNVNCSCRTCPVTASRRRST